MDRFNAVGVATVEQLAVFDPAAEGVGIMPQTLNRLTRQARLQMEARTCEHRYQLLGPEPRRGFGLLPAP